MTQKNMMQVQIFVSQKFACSGGQRAPGNEYGLYDEQVKWC